MIKLTSALHSIGEKLKILQVWQTTTTHMVSVNWRRDGNVPELSIHNMSKLFIIIVCINYVIKTELKHNNFQELQEQRWCSKMMTFNWTKAPPTDFLDNPCPNTNRRGWKWMKRMKMLINPHFLLPNFLEINQFIFAIHIKVKTSTLTK